MISKADLDEIERRGWHVFPISESSWEVSLFPYRIGHPRLVYRESELEREIGEAGSIANWALLEDAFFDEIDAFFMIPAQRIAALIENSTLSMTERYIVAEEEWRKAQGDWRG